MECHGEFLCHLELVLFQDLKYVVHLMSYPTHPQWLSSMRAEYVGSKNNNVLVLQTNMLAQRKHHILVLQNMTIVIMKACLICMWLSYLHYVDTISLLRYTIDTIKRHCVHYLHSLKYTICMIYANEIHYSHYLHCWNTLLALFELLKYIICTMYIIERHSLHDVRYWFTLLILSSHQIYMICTI